MCPSARKADRMLDFGFGAHIRKITGYMPVQRQVLLFSARFVLQLTSTTRDFWEAAGGEVQKQVAFGSSRGVASFCIEFSVAQKLHCRGCPEAMPPCLTEFTPQLVRSCANSSMANLSWEASMRSQELTLGSCDYRKLRFPWQARQHGMRTNLLWLAPAQ
eukprot:5906530-Amphidinium_carterae.1